MVTEDDRCPSVLKTLVKFDSLRFKDRDELEQVISSYYSVHEFDVRKNLVDWDFNMYVKDLMP